MDIVDHVFILLLLVVQPIYGAYEARKVRADAAAGKPLDRVKWYRETTIMEWIFLAVLVTAWFVYQRPFADLGLVAPEGTGFWLGAGFLVLVTVGMLIYRQRMSKMNQSERAEAVESLGDVSMYLPQNDKELEWFTGVSATAGVVEEIVYRGFVIWYFSLIMPLWPAVVASAVLFGLAHSYQGPSGAFRCGLLGLGFGAFYIWTGSIWLPIVGHFILDALQGVALRDLFVDDEELEAVPS